MLTLRTPSAVRGACIAIAVWMAAYELHILVSLGPLEVLFGRYAHVVVLLVAAAVCAARAVRHRPERLAWALIACAMLSWTLGELYYTASFWTARSVPVPSPADIGYLGVYPLAFAGLILLLSERARLLSTTLWVDGIIAALVVAALGAAVVFDGVLRTVGGRPISIATNLAYPLGDLLLLSVVVTAFTLRRWRPDRSALLLGIGIVCFWTADSLYLVESAQSAAEPDSLLNIIGWGGFLLVALAAWQPAGPMPRGETQRTISAPFAFAIVGLGLLVYATMRPVDTLAVALATTALVGVILRLVITFRENVELLRASRAEALTDALTGLGNRRHLMLDLEQRCAVGHRCSPFHVVLLDLDGFKAYNDRYGHPAGDALLARIGARFSDAMNPYGGTYRMGGDEFCALIESDEDAFQGLADAARAALTEVGADFAVEASHGVVHVPAEARTPGEVLRRADARLYRDKERRGSRRGAVEDQRAREAAEPGRNGHIDPPREGTEQDAAAEHERRENRAQDVEALEHGALTQ